MSEISRDMNTSTELDARMDLFQYYIHGIRGLISGDDFSPSSSIHSRLAEVDKGSVMNKGPAKEDSRCSEKSRPAGCSSLFCNAAGNGLSDHGKERLVTMLCQSVIALNEEVDEVFVNDFVLGFKKQETIKLGKTPQGLEGTLHAHLGQIRFERRLICKNDPKDEELMNGYFMKEVDMLNR